MNTKALAVCVALGTIYTASPAVSTTMFLGLNGHVTDATGNWSDAVGTKVVVNLVFDLDAGNAVEILDRSGVPDEVSDTRWVFMNDGTTGYGGSLVSPSGALGNDSDDIIALETSDNLDFDLLGNPFGVSGVRDVLSFVFGTTAASCQPSEQSPITGLCPPGSPNLLGLDYSVNIIGDKSWFNGGDVLPSSIPSNVMIFGYGEQYISGSLTAQAYIDFNSVAAIPLPAAGWLLLGGLAGLFGIRHARRRLCDSDCGAVSSGVR